VLLDRILGPRSLDDWIAEYQLAHQNPVNALTHLVGIPMIAVSIPLLVLSALIEGLFAPAVALFIAGWILQFVGHAFEGKKPEFFRDWRFLFIGLRWWIAKVTGRA
jgi:uncharacterized membrane protein YGL010W